MSKPKDDIQDLQNKMNALLNQFDRLSGDIGNFRSFLESLLHLLLDVSLDEDRMSRLSKLLSVAASSLPNSILELYVQRAIRIAHQNGVAFESLIDTLIRSLGEKLRELKLIDAISRTYGFGAAERWREIFGDTNPSSKLKKVEISE